MVLALTALAGTVHAEDSKNSMFSVSGFGTVGMTHSSIDNGDYVANLSQPAGAGRSHDWDLGVDSKLGVQIDAKFSEQLTGVVQVVAMTRSNNSFSPRVEWANLKYRVTPDLSLRVGRIALASFVASEARLVGYANPWVRTPIETYNINSITNSDGIDASYRKRVGVANNTLQAWYGTTKVDIVGQSGSITSGVKAKKLYGVADTVEVGALTVRGGVTLADFEIQAAPGFLITPRFKLFNIGAVYDPGVWFVQSEFSKSDFENAARAQKSFYVTAGYRWNAFTPYLTYSQVKPDDNQARLTTRDQKTYSAGVRWDTAKNTAIKLQWDRVNLADGNVGFFTNARPGLAGKSGNVVTLLADFVF